MIKLGLIGFGKTGKAVATVIMQNPGFQLSWVLRRSTRLENKTLNEILDIECTYSSYLLSTSNCNFEKLLRDNPVDYIIDFSSENGIYFYGESAAKTQTKIISAVSHYQKKELDYLKKISEETAVFWSPNITLGVNYLIFAARFLKKIAPLVDIEIVEEHFKQKSGVSGTAIKIAEALNLANSDISSIRAGGIVGKHQVIFGFKYQTIRLIHESISREAFGNGVIFVAQNMKSFNQGFYNYDDILEPYLNNKNL